MNRKILVADDKQEYLQIAMNYILEEDVPYALFAAKNGKIALEIAKKELPDIIIMDWEMPEMNGIETMMKLREDELTKDIPVIISTGIRISPNDLKIALDAGASDFIRKPVDKTEFLSRISSHLKMADYISTIKKQQSQLKSAQNIQKQSTIQSLQNQLELSNTQLSIFEELVNTFTVQLNRIVQTDDVPLKLSSQIGDVIAGFKVSFKNMNRFNSENSIPNSIFVNALLKEHNNLTPQEIKLCFMLKNDLSTKEIAELCFKAENSIKVLRSKLRKKLALCHEENLPSYLQRY